MNWRGATRNTLLTEGRDNSPEDDAPALVAGTPLNMLVGGPSCHDGPPSSSVSDSQCASATVTAAGFVVAQVCGTDSLPTAVALPVLASTAGRAPAELKAAASLLMAGVAAALAASLPAWMEDRYIPV